MSQNENVATQIKPWLNTRVNDLWADQGLTPGCLKLPLYPNSYFISNGTYPVPTPQGSVTANARFARIEIPVATYPNDLQNVLINPVPTYDSTTGLSYTSTGITFNLYGTYLCVINMKYNTTGPDSVEFNVPNISSDYSNYDIPRTNIGEDNSFVYSVYVNSEAAGYFGFTMQFTVDNPTNNFDVLAGSHITIIQFSSGPS